MLQAALEAANIRVHTLESRAKTVESFGRKVSRPSETDPEHPKHPTPLHDITDLAGTRVITFLLNDVERVNAQVESEFRIIEKINKTGLLVEQENLGYHSVHYLVGFSDARRGMPEYARFGGLTTEIQVRTILQHAWAEIEHDIQYKAIETIPSPVRRRFMALAGLLEIADREFQAVSEQDEELRTDARHLIDRGQLDQVEVTQDSLKTYLDRKLEADRRMTSFSYAWTARIRKRLGFSNLHELDNAISGYDDDRVSRIVWGSRQGQISRLEDVLLASLGERYIERHPWARNEWFAPAVRTRLQRLRDAGVEGHDGQRWNDYRRFGRRVRQPSAAARRARPYWRSIEVRKPIPRRTPLARGDEPAPPTAEPLAGRRDRRTREPKRWLNDAWQIITLAAQQCNRTRRTTPDPVLRPSAAPAPSDAPQRAASSRRHVERQNPATVRSRNPR